MAPQNGGDGRMKPSKSNAAQARAASSDICNNTELNQTTPEPIVRKYILHVQIDGRHIIYNAFASLRAAHAERAKLEKAGWNAAVETLSQPSVPLTAVDRQRCAKVLLSAFSRLLGIGLHASDRINSPYYLPRLALEYELAAGFSEGDLACAMRSLMIDGVLKRERISRYGNRTPSFELVFVAQPAPEVSQ
jgi:hypothetical protein